MTAASRPRVAPRGGRSSAPSEPSSRRPRVRNRSPAHSSPGSCAGDAQRPGTGEKPPLAAKWRASGYRVFNGPEAPHWDAAIEQLRPYRWAFSGDERCREAPSPSRSEAQRASALDAASPEAAACQAQLLRTANSSSTSAPVRIGRNLVHSFLSPCGGRSVQPQGSRKGGAVRRLNPCKEFEPSA